MPNTCTKQPKEKPIPIMDQEKPDRLSIITINRVMELQARKVPRVPGAKILFFDANSGKKYSWMEPGWVAQERHMPDTGRIYRYYYDPSGFKYDKEDDARFAFADMKRDPDAEELVAIDVESSGVSDEREEAPVV